MAWSKRDNKIKILKVKKLEKTNETEEVKGIIAIIAKTGGIKLKEQQDQWFNPTSTAKPYIKQEFLGKKVILRIADKPNEFSFISLAPDQPEEEPKETVKSKSSPKVVNIKGKDFITYAGLLEKAHEKGLVSFEILGHWQSEDLKNAWCKVRAHCIVDKKDCFFDGIGSSTPENNKDFAGCYPIEMAHTRAHGRALRDFLNIGEAMLEELKSNK